MNRIWTKLSFDGPGKSTWRTLAAISVLGFAPVVLSASADDSGAPPAGAAGTGEVKKDDGFKTPTAMVNALLPKWIRFSGDERMRMEGFLGGGFKPGNDDVYVLQRMRFGMKLIPTSWLRFEFQVQDARVWSKELKPYGPPFQATFDLRLANVEFAGGERMAGLRVGRQELAFGEERLVGNTNWGNAARSFDAARGTFHKGKFRVDAFASSVVVLQDGNVGDHQPGNNFHGIYSAFENVIPGSTFEPYVLWRLTQRQKTELGALGNTDFLTYGVRWVGKLPGKFDYNVEMAKQSGSLGTDQITAWAGHWVVGRKLDLAWKPRVMAEYNFATGDGNAKDGRRQTFDQLYPTAHDKYGLADQVGWKNIHHIRSGIELNPHPKWALSAKYSSYWLADAHDALYNASSAVVAKVADGSGGRFVGQELDATVVYKFSKQLTLGGGFAHIFVGRFLETATPGVSYNGPYLMLQTSF